MTGLLCLKTGNSRLFRFATRSVTCTGVRALFSPRSHNRHLPFAPSFPLLSNCSKTPISRFYSATSATLREHDGTVRFLGTILSGFKVQTCPVIKYKSVRYLSAARNGFPVFKYTEFTSNGVRPAFKYSSTAGPFEGVTKLYIQTISIRGQSFKAF